MAEAEHPLGAILDAAARGDFPPADGRFEVLPGLPGSADAMIGFTGHFVLAADISRDAVSERVPEGDFSVPMSAAFLTWIGECIGSRPLTFDALLCAHGTGAGPPDWLARDDDAEHPRVARARRYRADIDVWRTRDGDALLAIGRGVCRRWEIGFEIAPDARDRGLGRRVVAAARGLVPDGVPLWAQVAPGNAASLRAVLGGGFVPVAAEVLFPRVEGTWIGSRTMADEYVTITRSDDGVAELQLNRAPMNPLSQAMLAAIRDAARALAADGGVKAVVVTGSDRVFAAGADIDEFGDSERARAISVGFREAFDAVAAIPRPVIAAIHGYALGGGLELAMACDLRVAADNARVGQPEILLGIIPGAGGTQRLARLVGPARAKELIWSGRQVRAEEALAIGVVDRVVPKDEVLHIAHHWAAELGKGAVVAMGLAKRAIDDGLGGSLAEGLDLEARLFVEVFDTEDAATGVASFREHGPGKARFAGR